MCEGKKNKPKHLCYNLCHLKLQWISVYFSPKRINFDNTVPENPSPAVFGKLTDTAYTQKHRSLAHSCCKIKEVQSHISTIININTTGFRRIS